MYVICIQNAAFYKVKGYMTYIIQTWEDQNNDFPSRTDRFLAKRIRAASQEFRF